MHFSVAPEHHNARRHGHMIEMLRARLIYKSLIKLAAGRLAGIGIRLLAAGRWARIGIRRFAGEPRNRSTEIWLLASCRGRWPGSQAAWK